MNNSTTRELKNLSDEVRAIKASYAQQASNIITYTHTVEVEEIGEQRYIVTFTTDDGSNAIAVLLNAIATRLPYDGGAQWATSEVYKTTLIVRSIQKGEVSVE